MEGFGGQNETKGIATEVFVIMNGEPFQFSVADFVLAGFPGYRLRSKRPFMLGEFIDCRFLSA